MTDEPFKATDEDWAYIEWAGGITDAHSMRTIRELRDRVAALEAERTKFVMHNETDRFIKVRTPFYVDSKDLLIGHSIGTAKPIKEWGKDHIQVPPTTVPTPPAAVPSDRVLWEVQLEAKSLSRPHIGWQVWSPESEPLIAGHRALYDHGFRHGLAAGRAEQGGTPEPEPVDLQTLHGIALDMVASLRPIVLPEILNTLRRAIREPMAEPKPDAEPDQAPAGNGGLVKEVLDAMGEGTEVEARKAIFAVAKWLRSWLYKDSAADLEREAQG
jgi:hypothetical protein